MKLNTVYILLVVFCLPIISIGQIDSRKNNSFAIPAIAAPVDTTNVTSIAPVKTDKIEKPFSLPKELPELKLPEKEFSMFPTEEFANPGELYTNKLNKIQQTLLPEGHNRNSGLKEDAYWGDYKTTSNSVRIQYRDHGRIDGDLLRIHVNGNVIKAREFLNGGFNGFNLKLEKGFNTIEFYAINEGDFKPNTAQYRILDDNNKIISGKIWSLAAGVKVTIIIVKE